LDKEAANSLAAFRRWAYSEFGGVSLAFQALDEDGSGSLSFREFRKSVKDYRFKGDAQAIWNTLNVDGDTSINKWEVAFLDDWEMDLLATFRASQESSDEAAFDMSIFENEQLQSDLAEQGSVSTRDSNSGYRKRGLPRAWVPGAGNAHYCGYKDISSSSFGNTSTSVESVLPRSHESRKLLLKLVGLDLSPKERLVPSQRPQTDRGPRGHKSIDDSWWWEGCGDKDVQTSRAASSPLVPRKPSSRPNLRLPGITSMTPRQNGPVARLFVRT
jgi:hypothetical protein